MPRLGGGGDSINDSRGGRFLLLLLLLFVDGTCHLTFYIPSTYFLLLLAINRQRHFQRDNWFV